MLAVKSTMERDLLSDQEYQELESQGLLFNNNLDGDCWSNYFEREITKTPIDVPNDVYAIVMTMAGHEYPPVVEMFDILEKMKVPEENIWDLSDEKNSAVHLEAAVDEVAQKADSNDNVFVFLNAHGLEGGLLFKNGIPSRLVKVGEDLDKIESNSMTVILDTCESGFGIGAFKGNKRLVLTSGDEQQKTDFGIGHEFLKAFTNPSADTDNNNYVSIGEAAEYAKEVGTIVDPNEPNNPKKNRTPLISDMGNIGLRTYLFEFKLED